MRGRPIRRTTANSAERRSAPPPLTLPSSGERRSMAYPSANAFSGPSVSRRTIHSVCALAPSES